MHLQAITYKAAIIHTDRDIATLNILVFSVDPSKCSPIEHLMALVLHRCTHPQCFHAHLPLFSRGWKVGL